ncbi:MAG: endolytic transglycosylase MltG [Bacteroidaceae bacterium]|nr:endolytic transglycosylase MltG [Bacteroidaceae bacterium]
MRWCVLAGLLALLMAVPAVFLTSSYDGDEVAYLYVYDGDEPSVVEERLSDLGVRTLGFGLLDGVLDYRVRPGRYAVRRGESILALFRCLRNGQQEPLRLTIPSVRTLGQLYAYLGERLMVDSTALARALANGWADDGHRYTEQTLPALFVPNTYEVYWNVSTEELLRRMQREQDAFWQGERDRKARAMGMTREEVATLASIVDEETANDAEKPMVAGMYVKRLAIGMPLQADPTVKFALGDFSLRRIWGKHLTIDSPYNTYKNTGLPPGPIRIASVAGIDAVLDHVRHDYIYMCAKEDFSGTHNFARTYQEHLQNAKRYAQALNQRGIR